MLHLTSALPCPKPRDHSLNHLHSINYPYSPLRSTPRPITRRPFSPILKRLPRPPLHTTKPTNRHTILPRHRKAPQRYIPLSITRRHTRLQLLCPNNTIKQYSPNRQPTSSPRSLHLYISCPRQLFYRRNKVWRDKLVHPPYFARGETYFPTTITIEGRTLLITICQHFQLLPPDRRADTTRVEFPTEVRTRRDAIYQNIYSCADGGKWNPIREHL